jgi:hypothetical protein
MDRFLFTTLHGGFAATPAALHTQRPAGSAVNQSSFIGLRTVDARCLMNLDGRGPSTNAGNGTKTACCIALARNSMIWDSTGAAILNRENL